MTTTKGTTKRTLYILTIFAIFGIFFIVGLLHEGFHVVTGQDARSVCWDFGYKIQDAHERGFLLFHTEYGLDAYGSVEAYNTWREYNEKIATILSEILLIVMGFLLGILFNNLYYGYFNRRGKRGNDIPKTDGAMHTGNGELPHDPKM